MRMWCKCKGVNKTNFASRILTGGALTKEKRRRRGLLSTACLYTPILAGAFFGWGPFQLMLEQNGNFHSRCNGDLNSGASVNKNKKNVNTETIGSSGSTTKTASRDVCPEQTASLLNIPLISQALALGMSPVLGWVCDKFGAPSIVYLMTCFITIGLGMVVVASHYVLDQMMLPGFIFFGFGAVAGSALTVQTGLVWRNHRQGQTRMRIISLLNNLYDAGAITPLLLWYIMQWIPMATVSLVIGCYLAVGLAILLPACFFWSRVQPLEDEAEEKPTTDDGCDKKIDSCNLQQHSQDPINDVTVSATEMIGEVRPPQSNGKESKSLNQTEGACIHSIQNLSNRQHNDEADNEMVSLHDEIRFSNTSEDIAAYAITKKKVDYVLISDRPPMEQLCSLPYLLLCVYFALSMMINLWTLSTARDFLAYLGDDEYDNLYLTIFTLLTPISILGVPLVDVIVQRFGYHGGMQAVNILGIVQGIIKVSSTNLNVQILGFVVYSFFRSFFFSVTFSFLPTILSLDATGKGAGLLTFCGILSFVNAPIANVTVNKLDGNFFIPNMMFTLLGVPCIALAFSIEQIMKKERAARSWKEDKEQKLGSKASAV